MYVCYDVVNIEEPHKSHVMIKRNENDNVVGKPTEKNHFKIKEQKQQFHIELYLRDAINEDVIWNEPAHDGQPS